MTNNIIRLRDVEPEGLADARDSFAKYEKLREFSDYPPKGVHAERALLDFMIKGPQLIRQAFEGIEEVFFGGRYLPVYKKRVKNVAETHLKIMLLRAHRKFQEHDQINYYCVALPLFSIWAFWLSDNQTNIPINETWLARNIGKGVADELWTALHHLNDESNRLGFNSSEED